MNTDGAAPSVRLRTARWLPPVVCGLAPLILFLPALAGGFLIWDDNVNLLNNTALWQAEGAVRWMFTDLESVQRYKALNWLLWRMLGDGFGLKPVAFHAANLLLHAFNAVLLYYVIVGFLGRRPGLGTSSFKLISLSAAAGALTWALHPLRVEPVAWISGVGYPLSTLFALLTVLAFQRHLRGDRPACVWIAVGCFILSLLSYPAAAALPALLLMLLWLDANSPAWTDVRFLKRALRLLVPYAIPAVLLLGLTLSTRLATSGAVWHRPASLDSTGLLERIVQAFAVWVWYLEKTLLPLHLSPVYVDFRDFSAVSFRAVNSLLVFTLAGLLAWRVHRRWPEVGPLSLAWLLLAVPVLGVTDIPFIPSDRYTYVPGLALALLTSVIIVRVANVPTLRQAATIVPIGILAVMILASGGQLANWRSPVAFFHHAQASITPHPTTADLHWRLGLHYLMMDQPQAAREEFASTLRLNPHHQDAARYIRVLQQRLQSAPQQNQPQ